MSRLVQLRLLEGGPDRHYGYQYLGVLYKYALGATLRRRSGYMLGFAMRFFVVHNLTSMHILVNIVGSAESYLTMDLLVTTF